MHESGGGGGSNDPHADPLDPHGPMGMPKIVSRVAERLGHGPRAAGNVVVWMYLLSVLAIMIAFGIFFIVGGH
jgi:hypothetical protein